MLNVSLHFGIVRPPESTSEVLFFIKMGIRIAFIVYEAISLISLFSKKAKG